MIGNKLTGVLVAFEKSDWKAFETFLAQGKLFQIPRHKTLLAIAKELQKGATLPQKNEAKEEAHLTDALSKAKIPESEWSKIASYMMVAVEKYLMTTEVEKDPGLSDLLTSSALASRPIDSTTFQFHLAKMRKRSEEREVSAKSWLWRHLAGYEALSYRHNFVAAGDSESDRAEMETNLDLFYYTQKLKIACAQFSMNRVLRLNLDMSGMIRFIEEIKKISNLPPLVRCYQVATELEFSNEADEAFIAARMMLEKHGNRFSLDDLSNLYGMVFNYVARKINNGGLAHIAENALQLYEQYLNVKSLAVIGKGRASRIYKNYITLAVRLGETKRAMQFVKKYDGAVSGDDLSTVRSYGAGLIHFFEGNFKPAIAEFEKVKMEFEDAWIGFGSMVFLAKCYYQVYETYKLENLLDSMRKYVSRSKLISREDAENFPLFHKYFSRLYAIVTGNPKLLLHKLESIRSELVNDNDFLEKQWILEQISIAGK